MLKDYTINKVAKIQNSQKYKFEVSNHEFLCLPLRDSSYFLHKNSKLCFVQLSDAEKRSVPEHVTNAARQMNRKAFEERLREIQMSEYDAQLYQQYSAGSFNNLIGNSPLHIVSGDYINTINTTFDFYFILYLAVKQH